ncbi:MAG: YicC/YloC family endoribonuclease [Panacagrimonas sp.]
MIRSMTGYARVETQGTWGRLSWELRSVNHRYFDFSIKAPEDFRSLDGELRQLAAARIARGKIEASLRYVRDPASTAQLDLDLDRVRELKQAMARVSTEWGPLPSTDPLRLLAFPGVLREPTADFTALLEAARTLFDQALRDFNESRAREGGRLESFLVDRCATIEQLVTAVRARYAEVRGQGIERLRTRARELGVELDPGRMEQEMVIALQRLDVEEEMSRLLSHLVEVRNAIKRDEAIGRRLDFLMQELNREANTLSSKSQDAELTRHAVEMKVVIEQMREQVQNLE